MSFEVADTLDMSTPDAKRASYDLLVAQVRAVLEGERDWLANLAQFSALVYQSVPDLNWAGFYMARGEAAGEVVVTLADNGIGISAEALPMIWEPFVQDPLAIGFSKEGLGVGLTLVRELVQAHGGSVGAVSAGEGQGSEFTVVLPLA